MKPMRVFFLAALSLVVNPVFAQTPLSAYDPETDAQERARISAERKQEDAAYQRARADCYQRFAVNSCLRDARRAHRVVIEALRKQEIALNDLKRSAETQEHQQRVEQKQVEHAQQETQRQQQADERAKKEAEREERKAQQQKQQQQQRKALPAATTPADTPAK